MRHMRHFIFLLVLLGGCAYLDRGCSSCGATAFGADWIVVELTEAGAKLYRCWELTNTTITSEESSDGIYWKDSSTGNLIHVSGSYDYVQVKNNNWADAFRQLNLSRESCKLIRSRQYDVKSGIYLLPGAKTPEKSPRAVLP